MAVTSRRSGIPRKGASVFATELQQRSAGPLVCWAAGSPVSWSAGPFADFRNPLRAVTGLFGGPSLRSGRISPDYIITLDQRDPASAADLTDGPSGFKTAGRVALVTDNSSHG